MTGEPQVRPKGRSGRSGIVVPHRPRWHGEIAACAIWLVGRSLSATWRLEIKDESGLPEGPFIAAIWHNRLALAMPIWRSWQKRHPTERLAALISASRDGALISRAFSYFGVKPIRGSSSRRGAQALVELNSALSNGYDVALTPDGPRGPKYKVKPGIISLAQLTGVPIVPVGVNVVRKRELSSWDAFQIPLPFTLCRAVFGRSIAISRDASSEQREQARLELERKMLSLNDD
jgi:lysophospholipid acyltransferase (LPLAT)-like uncharacterized protein